MCVKCWLVNLYSLARCQFVMRVNFSYIASNPQIEDFLLKKIIISLFEMHQIEQ